jgi:phosphoglycerol transferase MdoB-like AlkP superfamily enzyme
MNLIEFRYGAFVAHGINAYRSLLTALEHLDQEERASAIQWVGTQATGQQDNQFTALAKGKSIYLIQIESLQDFVIGRNFEGREITPNINRLVDQSYYFENGRTVVGGGGTADSDFSANTSLYPLQESSVVVQYGADDFTGLPKALRGDGYSVNAYHGYRRDFWNRGTAFSSFGFEHFFAGEEYQINEKIIMGLSDESFYRQTLDKLSNEGSPTFNFVVSLSSHHPFIMAEKYQTLGGDVSKYDFKTFHYLQAVHYADYALGIFLDGLKERGLYEDSLVIVYGDHPAKIGDLNDPNVQKMINGFEMKEMDKIPFIYKLPVQKNGYKIPRETNQLDIMPTILNLTGTKTNFPMFGGDVLEGTKRNITREEAIHYSELLIRFNLFEDFSR